MGSLGQDTPYKTITVKELHPTFAAEVKGVDFKNLSDEQFSEMLDALHKYGVCVFRSTGMNDSEHVEFSRRFGDLDDMKRYMTDGRRPRYHFYELFDAGNVDEQGNIVPPDSQRAHFGKGNTLFHVDSSFNARRASFSLLRSTEIPPPGNGGTTDFADSRKAYEDLPEDLLEQLKANDYVAAHSIQWSRKLGSPEFFKDLDPTTLPMGKHRVIQKHEPSGRMNLYVAAHAHHIEGMGLKEGRELLNRLLEHTTQKKYVTSIAWENVGDMIIWDNRCVLHRATGGSFEGKYRRDLRRTTVHDDSPTAWGLNEKPAEVTVGS